MAEFFCKYLFCFDIVVAVLFPQDFRLCHNYIKIYPNVQVSLGKLIKRIKTVTMGLTICAKHSDVTASMLRRCTSERDTRNINSKKTGSL